MNTIVPFVEFDLSHFLRLLMVSSDEAPFFAHILHFHNKPAGILNFADSVAHVVSILFTVIAAGLITFGVCIYN